MAFQFDADAELKPKRRTRKPKAKAEAAPPPAPEPPAPEPEPLPVVAGTPVEPMPVAVEPAPRRTNRSWPRNGHWPARDQRAESRQRGHNWAKSNLWAEPFLKLYAHHGNASRAADDCGISTVTVKKRRESDPEFRARYDEATAESDQRNLDRLEEALDQLAVEGEPDIRMNKDGQFVMVGRRKNVIAGIFRTKRLDPRYRDNYQSQQAAVTASVSLVREMIFGPPIEQPPPENDPEAMVAWHQAKIDALKARQLKAPDVANPSD